MHMNQVAFRESVALSQHFKYCFGPISLSQCGHIPHEEIPKGFVQMIQDIVCNELKAFKARSPSEQSIVEDPVGFINQGAHKIKEMLSSINIRRNVQHEANVFDSATLASSIVAPNDEDIAIAEDVVIVNEPEMPERNKLTEKSRLLID